MSDEAVEVEIDEFRAAARAACVDEDEWKALESRVHFEIAADSTVSLTGSGAQVDVVHDFPPALRAAHWEAWRSCLEFLRTGRLP